jgi:hypothetical protein
MTAPGPASSLAQLWVRNLFSKREGRQNHQGVDDQRWNYGGSIMRTAELRRDFLKAFWKELRVVWPILSVLIFAQLGLGMLIGLREGWAVSDATYFTFVTGLTIGYGDLVPAHLGTRVMAIMIGFSGSLLTGLIAAVGVRALQGATGGEAR